MQGSLAFDYLGLCSLMSYNLVIGEFFIEPSLESSTRSMVDHLEELSFLTFLEKAITNILVMSCIC